MKLGFSSEQYLEMQSRKIRERIKKFGGKLYGHFDIDEITPLQLMPNSDVPTIFFHGDNDEFVPYDMSKKNFDACGAKNKKFVTITGAGHATAYLTDTEKYTSELLAFINPLLYE